MRVMMSAAGSPVAHGIIRHLQSLGHYVIGHDRSPYGSVADKFYRSPDIATEPKKYLDFLTYDWGDSDVYLPFLDEELRLPDFNIVIGVNTPVSPAKTLAIFTSKIKQHYALERAGLPTPDWAIAGDVIAKPEYGRGGKGHIRLPRDHALTPELGEMLAECGYHTQRFIHGDEYTVDALVDRDGRFLDAVPRLRIATNGVSTIGKIVMDPEIFRLVRSIVDRFEFRGPINVQIIKERDTGNLYIIEVNPRLSGSCMFTVMAGFDILQATIRMHLGLPFQPPERIREITVKRHYVEEII